MLPCGVLSAVFTIGLYIPVIQASGSITAITANSFVKPVAWAEFFRLMPLQLQITAQDFFRDVPPLLVFTFFILMALGLFAALKKCDFPALLLLPSFLVGSALVLFMQRALPFPRTWIYFIPIFIITADYGFAWLMERAAPNWQKMAYGIISAGCILCALALARANAILHYPDTGVFLQAPAIAAHLNASMSKNDRLVVRTPDDWTVYYYLWRLKSPIGPQNEKANGKSFIVTSAFNPIEKHTNKPAQKVFEYEDAGVYVTQ
jgi:hypothetical protein